MEIANVAFDPAGGAAPCSDAEEIAALRRQVDAQNRLIDATLRCGTLLRILLAELGPSMSEARREAVEAALRRVDQAHGG